MYDSVVHSIQRVCTTIVTNSTTFSSPSSRPPCLFLVPADFRLAYSFWIWPCAHFVCADSRNLPASWSFDSAQHPSSGVAVTSIHMFICFFTIMMFLSIFVSFYMSIYLVFLALGVKVSGKLTVHLLLPAALCEPNSTLASTFFFVGILVNPCVVQDGPGWNTTDWISCQHITQL